jgi:hypothetical protein
MLPAGHTTASDSSLSGTRRSGWIVSPLFDLLFIANLLWLLAFLPGYVSPEGQPYIQFWMAYFIATPHRWMTIGLVAFDPDRRSGRTWLFVLIALLTAVLIAAVRLATGAFACLALFYTVLLGWHFASQHAGILRIYSRKAGGGRRWLETWPPRVFILYASLRTIPGFDTLGRFFWLDPQVIDLAVLAIPLGMLAVELVSLSRQRVPKLIYMISFCGLWSSVLLAGHAGRETLSSVLLAAVTVFHSVEYLAVVSYYARRRQKLGSAGLFQKMARNWTAVFAWYVVSCGLIYSFGDRYFVTAWFTVNLWASILHVVYDGLIWKLRDPATARVLDVEINPAPAT